MKKSLLYCGVVVGLITVMAHGSDRQRSNSHNRSLSYPVCERIQSPLVATIATHPTPANSRIPSPTPAAANATGLQALSARQASSSGNNQQQ